MAERWITWHGRHLLVDDNGKIVNNKIIAYHGSQYNFDKFDTKKAKENNNFVNLEEGHYFAQNKETATDYGDYLYEVEIPKDKAEMSGGFWQEQNKEYYVVKNDNDIKILNKWKVNRKINTKDIKDKLDDKTKKYNSLLKMEKEWKQTNANVDWNLIKNDKIKYQQEISKLQKEYEKLNSIKYTKI